MNIVTVICFAILGAAGLACIVRLVRPGSSLADRIVALDSFLVVFVSALAVYTVRSGDDAFVNVTLVAALLGFLGTVTVARYIERRGA